MQVKWYGKRREFRNDFEHQEEPFTSFSLKGLKFGVCFSGSVFIYSVTGKRAVTVLVLDYSV